MSAVFRPGQRVRCVKRDWSCGREVLPGEALTVGRFIDAQCFIEPAGPGRWYCAHFIPADQPGPWTDHDGGACPVGPDVRVEVRLRNGFEPPPCPASEKRWVILNNGCDIVAYRLAADPPDATAETEAARPPKHVRLAKGIAAIKADIEVLTAEATDERDADRVSGMIAALAHFRVTTTIHPPQPARVEFTEVGDAL